MMFETTPKGQAQKEAAHGALIFVVGLLYGAFALFLVWL